MRRGEHHVMSETQEAKLSELHAVCALGDSDQLQELLASKHDHLVDYKDPDWGERAPLHWSCMQGRGDMVRLLLEKGAHPGVRSHCGWTPAHYAAETGRTHILRILHQHNAPMIRKDIHGDTPKRLAEVYGHKEAAEFLIMAETEYKSRRRKCELSGEATPHDDEDMEWCRINGVKPDSFVTEKEMMDLASAADAANELPAVTKQVSKLHHKQHNKRTSSIRSRKQNVKNLNNENKKKSPTNSTPRRKRS